MRNLDEAIAFAKIYDSFGWSVQQQLDDILDMGRYAEVNPNAVEVIRRRIPDMPYEVATELKDIIDDYMDNRIDD